MARRAHRKSRGGCIECKRRHIKCDEQKPICSNCISSERKCDFASPILASRAPNSSRSSSRVSRRSQLPDDAQGSRDSSLNPREPQNEKIQSTVKTAPVDMQHVKLLHHLCKETLESLRPEIESVGFTLHDAFNEVFSAPYVLNQLLALAAIHLSTSNTETQGFYRQQAKELQTHALSIFNQMRPEANAETCVPLFIFSSTLGLHEMCEAFFFRVPDFEDFLDNFVHYLSLHKGVRAITGNTWHLLNQSIVGLICKRGEHIMAPVGDALGSTCSQLLGLVKAANLVEEYKNSCGEAISALQSIFGGPHRDVPDNVSTTAILSWPVILDTDYIELLRMREPHALLILAHFGALVHIRRGMWIFGDGGQFLVTLIAAHLGNEWSNWLAWPIGVVNGQSDQVSD